MSRTAGSLESTWLIAPLITLSMASVVNAEPVSFHTVDFPESTYTAVVGINKFGDLAGYYNDSAGHLHGFRRVASTFDSIDCPGAVGTWANGINDKGDVVGSCSFNPVVGDVVEKGFLLQAGANVPTYLPSPGGVGVTETSANGINASGEIVGGYRQDGYSTIWYERGLIIDSGGIRSVDYPGQYPNTFSNTTLWGIDNAGQIVGSQGQDGFLLAPDGFTIVHYPGSYETDANGISLAGIVGNYRSGSDNADHCFILRQGQYFSLEIPDARCIGISDVGVIVGSYAAADGTRHGFVTDLLGVDVSIYANSNSLSRDVDYWKSVQASGVQVVVVEGWAGGANTGDNTYAEAVLQTAREAGLQTAAYCFLNYTQTGYEQIASHCLSNTGSETPFLSFVAIDVEPYFFNVLDPATLAPIDVIADAVRTVRQISQQNGSNAIPLIYTSPDHWKDLTGNSTLFAGLPLWEVLNDQFPDLTANYPLVDIGGDLVASPWTPYAGWSARSAKQYDDGADGKGTQLLGLTIDRDIFAPVLFARAESPNTPIGIAVSAYSLDASSGTTPVNVIFTSVQSAGNTSVSVSTSAPQLPQDVGLGTPVEYFELATTAVFDGDVSACANYGRLGISDPDGLRLLQFRNGQWVLLSTVVKLDMSAICGTVSSLSAFVIADVGLTGAGILAPSITVTGGTLVYDGQPHGAVATASGSGGVPIAGSFSFTYTPGGSSTPVNAGGYAVTATFRSADPNYANGSGTGLISISPATPAMALTGRTFTYNGSPLPAGATATGVGGVVVAGSFTFTYSPGGSSAPVNVGTYSVSAAFISSDPNYTNASTTSSSSVPITIVSVSGPGLTGVGLVGQSLVDSLPQYFPQPQYLESAWSQTSTYTNVNIAVQFGQNGNTLDGTAYLMTQIGAGTTAASEVASGRFSVPDSSSVLVSVLTVPSLGPGSYYLVISPDTVGNWWNTRFPVFTQDDGVTYLGYSSASSTASYIPAVPFGSQFTGAPLIFKVTGETPLPLSTISPATPTITLFGGSVTYDGTPHPVTAKATGVGGGPVAGSLTLTYTPGGTSPPVNAGTYTVAASFASSDSNYANASLTGSVTVSKAAASVTPSAAGKTYGSADPPLSGTLSGFVTADRVMVTYNRAAGETVGGGPYVINATLSPASALTNYVVTYSSALFTITPAPLIVAANAASRPFDTSNPPLTASYSGFQGTDTAAILTGSLALSTAATLTSPPGTYLVVPSGVASPNYIITFLPGHLTIADVPPVAANDTASTLENMAVTIPVLTNDTDLESSVLGQPLSISSITAPSHGSAVASANSITYTPAPNFFGTDSFTYTVSDGYQGAATATVTVSVSRLARFVALSTDFTWLRTGALVTRGDIGAALRRVHDHAHGQDFDDGDSDDVTVRVGVQATVQQASSRVVGDTVALMAQSTVYNVVDNFLMDHRGTILGTTTSPMPVPFVTLPVFPTVTAGTKDITVAKNKTVTLAAGSYGAVHVTNGATLILSGGLYQVRSLDVDQSATVLFHAATEIRIKTELDSDAKSKLILDPSMPRLDASQVVIYVAGDDRACQHAGLDAGDGDYAGPTVVHIGENNVVQANIYAPNGTVWLKSKTQATGAFIGAHVRIGIDTQLSLDSAFK